MLTFNGSLKISDDRATCYLKFLFWLIHQSWVALHNFRDSGQRIFSFTNRVHSQILMSLPSWATESLHVSYHPTPYILSYWQRRQISHKQKKLNMFPIQLDVINCITCIIPPSNSRSWPFSSHSAVATSALWVGDWDGSEQRCIVI